MAVTYKDIGALTPKATLDGNEKVPVSETQYITAQQIARLGGDGELIVFRYEIPSETASHFYTANKEAIDSLVAKCIAGDRPRCGMYISIEGSSYFVSFNYVWGSDGSATGSIVFSPGMFVGDGGAGFNYAYITGTIVCTDINNPSTTTSVQDISDLHSFKYPLIDYASLSEQAVPGEFWLSMSGNRKQVYLQSFLGTLSKNNTSIYVILKSSGISTAWIEAMNIRSTQWDIVSNVTGAFLRVDPATGELAFIISSDSIDNLDGKNYVLTVKFTKQ